MSENQVKDSESAEKWLEETRAKRRIDLEKGEIQTSEPQSTDDGSGGFGLPNTNFGKNPKFKLEERKKAPPGDL